MADDPSAPEAEQRIDPEEVSRTLSELVPENPDALEVEEFPKPSDVDAPDYAAMNDDELSDALVDAAENDDQDALAAIRAELDRRDEEDANADDWFAPADTGGLRGYDEMSDDELTALLDQAGRDGDEDASEEITAEFDRRQQLNFPASGGRGKPRAGLDR